MRATTVDTNYWCYDCDSDAEDTRTDYDAYLVSDLIYATENEAYSGFVMDENLPSTVEVWMCDNCNSVHQVEDDTSRTYYACNSCDAQYDDEEEAIVCCLNLCNGSESECDCASLNIGMRFNNTGAANGVFDAIDTGFWICVMCHQNSYGIEGAYNENPCVGVALAWYSNHEECKIKELDVHAERTSSYVDAFNSVNGARVHTNDDLTENSPTIQSTPNQEWEADLVPETASASCSVCEMFCCHEHNTHKSPHLACSSK